MSQDEDSICSGMRIEKFWEEESLRFLLFIESGPSLVVTLITLAAQVLNFHVLKFLHNPLFRLNRGSSTYTSIVQGSETPKIYSFLIYINE